MIQNMGKYVKMVQLFGSTAVKGRDSLNSFNNYGKYFHLTLYVKNERVKPTFLYLGQKFNFLSWNEFDPPPKIFRIQVTGRFLGLGPIFEK